MTPHIHETDEAGLLVEMHLREHMAEVHGHTADGTYADLYRKHAEEHETERYRRIGMASYNAAMRIRRWHAGHPGEPLLLSPAEVCALSGCTEHEVQS